jgi:hypothetical protein
VKAADAVAPPATVTVGGGDATALLPLPSVTTAPAAGAGPVRVTLFVAVESDPITLAGNSAMDATVGGFNVSEPGLTEANAVALLLVPETEMVYAVGADTASAGGATNVSRSPPLTGVTAAGFSVTVGPAPDVAGSSRIWVPAVVREPGGSPVARTDTVVTPGSAAAGVLEERVMGVWPAARATASAKKHPVNPLNRRCIGNPANFSWETGLGKIPIHR